MGCKCVPCNATLLVPHIVMLYLACVCKLGFGMYLGHAQACSKLHREAVESFGGLQHPSTCILCHMHMSSRAHAESSWLMLQEYEIELHVAEAAEAPADEAAGDDAEPMAEG